MKYYYKIETMRKYDKEWVEAQLKAEDSLGMPDNFILNNNGLTIQFVESEQADKFQEFVTTYTEEEFDKLCNNFFKAIKNKDKYNMFLALSIFDEMDNYNLGTPSMKRRLKRVREATHEISYNM